MKLRDYELYRARYDVKLLFVIKNIKSQVYTPIHISSPILINPLYQALPLNNFHNLQLFLNL